MALPNFLSSFESFKVKTKLIILLVLVAGFSVLFISIVSYMVGYSIINSQIDKELRSTSESIMDSVNKLIYNRFNDLQILITDSVLSDPTADVEEKTTVLRSSLVNLGWYENLYITDTNGEIISATDKTAVGENISSETWYQQTALNFINVSDITRPKFLDKEAIIFSNTLSDRSNKIIGMIIAEFSTQVIADSLKNANRDFEIFLLTTEDEIIAAKTARNLTKYEPSDEFIDYHIQSQGYLSFEGNNWKMVVQIPKTLAYAPLQKFSYMILFSLLIISGVVILVGNFSVKLFTKPIVVLTEGVSKIEKGDLNQKIEIKSHDEFGYLAENFNRMSASILEKTTSILQEKGKYKSILESTDEGIILFDLNNNAIAYNKRFLEISEKTPNEVSGHAAKIFNFLKQESDDPETKTLLPKISDLTEKNDFETNLACEITLNQPTFKILNLYTKPVISERGELLGRIWVFSEVTKEKQAEKNQNDFIKVASHKLRTPLTAINWNVEILKEQSTLSAEQKTNLDQLIINAERLNSLINVLLDAADIHNGKIDLTMSEVNLLETIKKSYEVILKRLPEDKKSELKIIDSEKITDLKVIADKNKLLQVLSFLLDNAFIYGKTNQANEVSVQVGIGESDQLTVRISDKGIGIPNEEKHEIFTKFFRGKNALLTYTEGTGLSLFLAKIIIESAGGKIWFDSKEGEGTNFYFTLKLAENS